MNQSKYETINNIRSRVNIVQVVGQYLSLEKKGNNYWALCPFHSDSNPSLSVSETKQVFNCFSCNTKGDVFTFVQMFKHIPYTKAIEEVCKLSGIDSSELKQNHFYNEENERYYAINFEALRLFKLNLKHETATAALAYLDKRNLHKALLTYFDIGYALNIYNDLCTKLVQATNLDVKINMTDLKNISLAERNKDDADFFVNRIIFPIHDENNNVIGFSGRLLDDNNSNLPKYLNTAGTNIFIKEQVLYNFNRVKNALDLTNIYLCEGYMDVIALHRVSILNAVAMMGVNLSTYHIKLLKNLKTLKEVVIALDADNAGKNATINAARKLIDNNIQVTVLDFTKLGAKDLDELINQNKDLNKEQLSQYQVDYLDFYINYEIQKLGDHPSSTNLVNAVQTILYEIKRYANQILWNKYLEHLSTKINVSVDDLKSQLNAIYVKHEKTQQIQHTSTKQINEAKFSYEINEPVYRNPNEKLIYDFTMEAFNKENMKIYFIKLRLLKDFYNFKKALVDFSDMLPGGCLQNDFFMKLYMKMSNHYDEYDQITQEQFLNMLSCLNDNDFANTTNVDFESTKAFLIDYIFKVEPLATYSQENIVKSTYELLSSINKTRFIKKQIELRDMSEQLLGEKYNTDRANFLKNEKDIDRYFERFFSLCKNKNK